LLELLELEGKPVLRSQAVFEKHEVHNRFSYISCSCLSLLAVANPESEKDILNGAESEKDILNGADFIALTFTMPFMKLCGGLSINNDKEFKVQRFLCNYKRNVDSPACASA